MSKSKYVLSQLISAYQPNGNYRMTFFALFGERVYGMDSQSGYITGVKVLATDTPAQYCGRPIERVDRVEQFGATLGLRIADRMVWIDDMSKVLGETPIPHPPISDIKISGINVPITADKQYLICKDTIYNGGFADPIELKDVIGGAYYGDTFMAWSPRVLLDVNKKKIVWIDPNCLYQNGAPTGRQIQWFVDGYIYLKQVNAQGQWQHWYTKIIEKQRKLRSQATKVCQLCNQIPHRFMTFGCGHSDICEVCFKKQPEINNKKKCVTCKAQIDVAVPTIPR